MLYGCLISHGFRLIQGYLGTQDDDTTARTRKLLCSSTYVYKADL